MATSSSPWETLTAEEVLRRLAALATSASPVFELGRCFSRDAVFSTGSAAIDQLLPDGGVACGTVLEIFGPPAAGKSQLVQRMVSAFAVRGSVEWTAMMRTSVVGENVDHQLSQEEEEMMLVKAEASTSAPHDWSVYFLFSDPSAVSPCCLRDLLKTSLASALANSVRCGHDADTLLLMMLKKVKLVPFASPNDLLVFFRFLSRVEYVESRHHANRRRVLIVVDNVARLWDHPMCGTTNHARHWMAAALVREVRNAILNGNGWRNAASSNLDEYEHHYCSHDADVSSQDIFVTSCGGSVAVVFVNGCTSLYNQHSAAATALPPKPLGVPVWWAAVADVRLYVEPLSNADVFTLHGKSNDGVCGTQQRVCATRATMRVRLVKGGCMVGAETTAV
ncbi:DNA repair protein [Trypanosoma rangeli]|uniref:DNA repair protein n=1 Tax=Trypanosoma rangeli TaxID=5698 RepID=A0A422NCK2_TRYRA|nr:DNA repair protein [Trypanosoma rangeli]RNF03201.1 DNA repair protein [Trypanosoma rangeli]|eukprot:RNF03201.1 DNA repair protein [Trypanosoma rangeli]